MQAVCTLLDSSGGVKGVVVFREVLGGVSISVFVSSGSLKPGEHGFHVHESGDMSQGCESMGPHFDLYDSPHGDRLSEIRHIGDLGNIMAADDGSVREFFTDYVIALQGDHNVIGRGLVIHENRDDLGMTEHELSKETGNSGSRVLCGVIRRE